MERDSSAFIADRALIQALENRSHSVPCSEGRVLFHQGDAPDGLYIVRNGEVVLIMLSEAGNQVMCLRAGAGSLLGLPGIIGNEPYTLTATASKGSEIGFVARDDFEDLMRAEPSLSLRVLQVLAKEVRSARQALSEI
jgi:CRP-like cAMP-binding protein